MKKLITKILKWADVDSATLFAFFARFWGIFAAPITTVILLARFSKVEQGYYMIFFVVTGFATYAELGLGRIIIQFASHEWSKLTLNNEGKVAGDKVAMSRLSSLAKLAVKWFVTAGLFIIIGFGIIGYIFISKSPKVDSSIIWQPQWILFCLCVGLNFMFYPLWYLLEGCGQVSYIYKFQFWRGVIGKISIWIAIYLGAGLWTCSVFYLVSFPIILIFIILRYKTFFKSLLFHKKVEKIFDWFHEILPMQWQLTVSSLCIYFMFNMFTGSTMLARGPVRAGETGVTWLMITTLGLLMTAFMAPKMPRFGMLIAQKKFKEFDKLFFKAYAIGSSILILGGITVIIGVCVLNYVPNKLFEHYASRILPPLPTAIFLIAYIFWVIMSQLSQYLIAHKKTPHWWIFVSVAFFAALSTWHFGEKYGLVGAGIGLIIVFIIHTPIMFWMWQKCRKEWHNE